MTAMLECQSLSPYAPELWPHIVMRCIQHELLILQAHSQLVLHANIKG
jgi:hypothetical protein